MRALRLQLFRIVFPRYPDHETKTALRAGSNTGNGILDYDGSTWQYPQHFRGLQERIRRRLAGKALSCDDIAVNTHIKKVINSCCSEDGITVLTRGHNGGFDVQMPQISQERD